MPKERSDSLVELFDDAFALEPLLEAAVMDVLHTASALAGSDERVLYWVLLFS